MVRIGRWIVGGRWILSVGLLLAIANVDATPRQPEHSLLDYIKSLNWDAKKGPLLAIEPGQVSGVTSE